MRKFVSMRKLLCLILAAAALMLPVGTFADTAGENSIFTLTIRYTSGGIPIAADYIAQMNAGSKYSVASPEIVNYALADAGQHSISGVLQKDTSFQVEYRYSAQEAPYKVHYIGRNIDGSGEIMLGEYDGKGIIGDVVTLSDKAFPGYVREPADMSIVVTADGHAAKALYYTKQTVPCVVFNTQGSYIPPVQKAAGADISSEMAQIPVPTRHGYTFAGWDSPLPGTMPQYGAVINALWNPGESEYTVQYYFQNVSDDGYTRNEGLDQIRTAPTGSVVTATDADIALGTAPEGAYQNPFFGFDYERCDDVKVTDDGKAVLHIYYTREIWHICIHDFPSFNGNPTPWFGEKDNYPIWKEFDGRYGAPVPDDYPTMDEFIAHANEMIPANKSSYKFVNLVNIGKHSAADIDLIFPTSFSNESNIGDHSICLGFLYETSVLPHTIFFYVQKLGMESEEYLDNDDAWELLNVKTATSSKPVTLNVHPPYGFTFERTDDGKVLKGHMRSGSTKEATMQLPWQEPTYLDHAYNPARASYKIYGYTEIRLLRTRSNIIYDSNGTVVKTVKDVYFDTPLEEYLKYEPAPPSDLDYFGGWYLSPDNFETGKPVKSTAHMPKDNLFLHARWLQKPFTVTFDSCGGTPVPPQSVENNHKAVRPENPAKNGRIFVGWYLGDGTRWVFDRPVTEDVTLYAVWRQVEPLDYKITHKIRGTGEILSQTKSKGVAGDEITAVPLPAEHRHYKNSGYLEPDAMTKSIELMENEDREITFWYSQAGMKHYTVSYLEDGTGKKLAPDKQVDTLLSEVIEKAADIKGYTPDEISKSAVITEDGTNRIVFLYHKGVDVPQTGDHFSGIWLALLPVCMLVLILTAKRRRE